jgi:hypothetical protein
MSGILIGALMVTCGPAMRRFGAAPDWICVVVTLAGTYVAMFALGVEAERRNPIRKLFGKERP